MKVIITAFCTLAFLTTAHAGFLGKLVEDVAKEVINIPKNENKGSSSTTTQSNSSSSKTGTFEDALKKFPQLKSVRLTAEEKNEQKEFVSQYKAKYPEDVAKYEERLKNADALRAQIVSEPFPFDSYNQHKYEYAIVDQKLSKLNSEVRSANFLKKEIFKRGEYAKKQLEQEREEEERIQNEKNSKEQSVLEVAERISDPNLSPLGGYKGIPWGVSEEDFKAVYHHKLDNGYEPLKERSYRLKTEDAKFYGKLFPELSDIFFGLNKLFTDDTVFLFSDARLYGVMKVVDGSLEESLDSVIEKRFGKLNKKPKKRISETSTLTLHHLEVADGGVFYAKKYNEYSEEKRAAIPNGFKADRANMIRNVEIQQGYVTASDEALVDSTLASIYDPIFKDMDSVYVNQLIVFNYSKPITDSIRETEQQKIKDQREKDNLEKENVLDSLF
jgi:hypothetical protein